MEHLSDGELRLLARKRIKSGDVPCTESPRVWAGPGRSIPCAICVTPIVMTQTEYEVEVLNNGVKTQTLHFHIPCHRAWTYECDKVPLAPTG